MADATESQLIWTSWDDLLYIESRVSGAGCDSEDWELRKEANGWGRDGRFFVQMGWGGD
jgi:hypothetical protein